MILRLIKAVIRLLPEEILWKVKPYYRIFLPNVTHIILIPSFVCNYRCPYCLVNRSKYAKIYPRKIEHGWKEWIEQLNKFPPAMINITGGEPFCYPDILPLVRNIPQKHLLAGIATNLSQPLGEFLKMSNKVLKVATSFHPHMTKKELFKSQIIKLKKSGFNLSINFVAYPQIIPLIPEFKIFFDKIKVKFHVDPFLDPTYEYTKEEAKIVKQYVDDRRNLGFDFKDYKPKSCRAGSKYFVIVPNGDVFACMAGFYYSNDLYGNLNTKKENFYLGNLFNGTFEVKKELWVCNLPCNEACDLESADVRYYQGR